MDFDLFNILDCKHKSEKGKEMICPGCKNENNDNWPIIVNNNVVEGGCQKCWENQCDANWWKMMIAIDKLEATNEPG